MTDSTKHFGGDWSDEKLKALKAYMTAYTTALKKTPFKLAYIDAFAGAGIHKLPEVELEESLFDSEDEEEEAINYRHGSPLIALETDPPFHSFIFIEKNADSLATLRNQIESKNLAGGRGVRYLEGDANQHLCSLAEKKWDKHRAVAFLDPFALEVSWNTISEIGKTQAIDMWLLFPAMAVNRMLPRHGNVPDKWAEKLTDLFGDESWRSAFYSESQQVSLFGDEGLSKVPRVFEQLSEYVNMRLQTVFDRTAEKPLVLTNKTGSPLFLLCFASGNPKGSSIAVRIANHIINRKSHGK